MSQQVHSFINAKIKRLMFSILKNLVVIQEKKWIDLHFFYVTEGMITVTVSKLICYNEQLYFFYFIFEIKIVNILMKTILGLTPLLSALFYPSKQLLTQGPPIM